MFSHFHLLTFLLVGFVMNLGHCAKILVLHPLHGGSHKVQLGILSEALVSRGHSITTVSFLNVGDQKPRSASNVTNINLSVNNQDGRYPYIEIGPEAKFRFPIELFWVDGDSPHSFPLNAFKMAEAHCRALLGNKELITMLKKAKFEAAIVDLISNECGLALLNVLGIQRVVAYWALFPVGGEMEFFPGFSPPSFVPSFLSKTTEVMGFWGRLKNVYLKIAGRLVVEVHIHLAHSFIQEYFPGAPHPKELIANIDGVLVNSDYALDYPKFLPPNFINVGAMQCRIPKDLPKDLKEFIDESKDIVIFSMGASLDAAQDLIPRLLKAFKNVNASFIMKGKYEGQTPSNVLIKPWIPQQDLLGHRKTRGFFTHCGLHGVMESIWHGIPIIGMPIFGDQFDVLARVLDRRIGVSVGKDAGWEEIQNAVLTVLNNEEFKEESWKLRRILRDHPQHPIIRATNFIEYVLRHNGANHLKSHARNMSGIQLYCLDLIAFATVILIVFIFIAIKILSLISSKFERRKHCKMD